METFRIVGLMSGTSLDGLDIALCDLSFNEGKWDYEIVAAETVVYDASWRDIFRRAHKMSALELAQLNVDFGIYSGKQVKRFLTERNLTADALASHGHTIFHQHGESLTVQIGSGAHIAANSGIKTICDFRTTDVAHGGQGAPLVPIGDRLLFSEYDFCLNIGGIANVSYILMGDLNAFDVCVANMALNLLAEQTGYPFDANGEMARRGVVNIELLEKLNSLSYYSQELPKSLGKEWFERHFLPLLGSSQLTIRDLLATCTEHMSVQIAQIFEGWTGSVLVTGGGAFNEFLIESIQAKTDLSVVVPDTDTVQYKEALIFALLGALRLSEQPTALSEVTGASKDTCGGCIYL